MPGSFQTRESGVILVESGVILVESGVVLVQMGHQPSTALADQSVIHRKGVLRCRGHARRSSLAAMDRLPPDHPFTSADLPDLGLTHLDVDRMVLAGKVRRAFRGGYLPTDFEETIEARAQLAGKLLPPGHVISGRTAAWLYDVDTYAWSESTDAPAIDACALPGSEPSDREGIAGHTRDLRPDEITELHGLRVTTPCRTSMDLGCTLRAREALAALDAFARLHGVTATVLEAHLPRFRRRRGVKQLRELAPLVDPRSESPRESWTRYEIHIAGVPTPELQHWVEIEGVPTYRLDLSYPRRRIAVEYNGYDAHERTAEQRQRDRERLEWLRANGWTVIVIRRGDFTGDGLDRWIGELQDALAAPYTPVRKLERGPVRG